MDKADIIPQRSYRFHGGNKFYVQDISGQKIIFNLLGDTDRREASLGRFAGMAACEVPNE